MNICHCSKCKRFLGKGNLETVLEMEKMSRDSTAAYPFESNIKKFRKCLYLLESNSDLFFFCPNLRVKIIHDIYSYYLQNFEEIFCCPKPSKKNERIRLLSTLMRKTNELLQPQYETQYPEFYLKLNEFRQKWRALDLDFNTGNFLNDR